MANVELDRSTTAADREAFFERELKTREVVREGRVGA